MLNGQLQLNDSGDNVKILQQKLKILGYYHSFITGNFALATEEGVKAFQKDAGLPITGIVDQETWNLLFQYTENAINPILTFPTLSLGSTGSLVTDLQTKLAALLYYTNDITGNFDLETENAVKRFQLNNELTATGIVNDQTWSLLNSLYGNLSDCAIENGKEDLTTTYTVQRGDTLYAIAKQFDTTVEEIKRLNNLSSNTLTIGQILKIPMTSDNNSITYTVVSGDTLYAIARRYNTTVDAIKALNGLSSNVLTIGQILKIPEVMDTETFSYIVQAGDTLYAIARRYNTTVDIIKQFNRLIDNTLTIGQVLKIPIQDVYDYITYQVQNGDTLYAIARRYNTTVDEIKEVNGLTTNILTIGQVLKIPIR